MAQILDGKAIAAKIRAQAKDKLNSFAFDDIDEPDQSQQIPMMAVVQVGEDPASTVYIKQKEKACAEVGLGFKKVSLPANISQKDMLAEVDKLNTDTNVHGFLIQQPLPGQLDTNEIVERIDPKKDVDCLHPYNAGLVADGRGYLLPCTPAGIIALLDAYDINLEGKHCVIIGRSRIVGKPLGLMMLERNATVTYCHSRTKNLEDICKQADVLAVAIGKANFVKPNMIKSDCVIIDVGINREKNQLCGDVDFVNCFKKASYITPVPGGVGPMTVAMLVANGVKAWENNR